MKGWLGAHRRVMAMFLAIVMVFSLFDGTVLTGFAAEQAELPSESAEDSVMPEDEEGQNTLAGETYEGYVDTEEYEGNRVFHFNQWEYESANPGSSYEDFNNAAIAVMDKLAADYDMVCIEYSSLYDEITKEMWNAVAEHSQREVWLNYGGNSEADHNWTFRGITTTESSVPIGITLNAESKATLSFTSTKFPAEEAEVLFFADPNEERTTQFNVWKTIFGTQRYCDLNVTDENDESVGTGWYEYQEDSLLFGVNHVQTLAADTVYTLSPKVYRGDVFDDEEGHKLYLTAFENSRMLGGKEPVFENEELVSIIDYYIETGEQFDVVEIIQLSSENNIVSADIYNKIVKIVKPSEGEEKSRAVFHFRNNQWDVGDEAADEEDVFWTLFGVKETTEDVSFDCTVTPGESGMGVTVNAGTVVFPADGTVRVSFHRGQRTGQYELLKAALGDETGNMAVVTADGDPVADVYGYYEVNDEWQYIYFDVENVQNLQTKTDYVLKSIDEQTDTEYFGYVDEEGNTLFVPAETETGLFSDGELEKILQHYVDLERKFDYVDVEEAAGSKNVIKKEVLNLAAQILKESTEEEQHEFSYAFRSGDWDKGTEEYITWRFSDIKEATEDINADLNVAAVENQGVKIKLGSNVYSGNVNVLYRGTTASEAGKILKSGLGDAEKAPWLMENPTEEDERGVDLLILKSGSKADQLYASYWKEDSDREGIGDYLCLGLDCAQDWTAGEEYQFVKAQFLGTIRQEYSLSLPEGAASLKCVSFSPDEVSLSVSGTVIKVKPIGWGDAWFTAAYKLNGKDYLKAYHAYTEIEAAGISFDRDKIALEPDQMDYLQVKWDPSNAAVDPRELQWTTSDPSVVELGYWDEERQENVFPGEGGTGYDGNIRAKSAGKSVIKATYNGKLEAVCEVTVLEKIEEYPEPYAIVGLDTKLSDVKLPAGWKWKYPDTKLSVYDVNDAPVSVIHSEDQREFSVGLRLVTIAGIEITGDIPDAMGAGESVTLGSDILIENGSWEEITERYPGRLSVSWSANPSGAGSVTDDGYTFTADAATGKKTFTVSLVDTQNKNKVLAKNSVSVTVVRNPVLKTEELYLENLETLENSVKNDKGELKFVLGEGDDFNLTVKSSDTSVLKLGKATKAQEDGRNIVKVPYEVKNVGQTLLSVTASDEVKSTVSWIIRILDKEPKILQKSLSINKNFSNMSAPLTICYMENFDAAGDVTVKDNPDFVYEQGSLRLVNKALKNGSYNITVTVPVQDGEGIENYDLTVKAVVVETKPKVTVKQTRKVNAFYTNASDEHAGLLMLTAQGMQIGNVRLEGGDFDLSETDNENVYKLSLRAGATGSAKQTTVKYTLTDGQNGTYEGSTNLRINMENKAPALVLSAKEDTLYPNQGYRTSALTISDKVTGEPVDIREAYWVTDKKKGLKTAITPEGITAQMDKNKFTISAASASDGLLEFELMTSVSGKDKFVLQAAGENWTRPVEVSYSIKTDIKTPKLKLSKTKVTLNKNDKVGYQQMEELYAHLSGCAEDIHEDVDIVFRGNNDKSAAVLNNKISLEHWGGGKIEVYLNTNASNNAQLEKGTYSFTVTAKVGADRLTTTLSVNVVDVAPEKCMKISKKGSIDLLLRDSTSIAYTPKISNLSGKVIDAHLEGENADMFESYYNEAEGKLIVRAREDSDIPYSTKAVYKVRPVFVLRTSAGWEYTVPASVQSVRITQGRPKITLTGNAGNVLYRQSTDSLNLNIAAMLKNEAVQIRDVRLQNYCDDLNIDFDQDAGMITVVPSGDMRQINKTGKTWNLKFEVTFTDQAHNSKSTVVTYKAVIK